MDSDKAVTATFVEQQYSLSVSSSGSGSVEVNPAGGTHGAGTIVTLTARPDPGFAFEGWSGDLTGSANPASLTMDSDKVVVASFAPSAALSVTISGAGTVDLSPLGGTYASGTVVTLTATPALGSVFEGWGGDLSGTANPTTITMDADKNVTATFAERSFTLAVSSTGSGSVALNPPGGSYGAGTTVTLTATPDPGFEFSSWGGDLAGTGNPTTITMDADKRVTADFVAQSFTLSVSTSGSGTLDLSPPGGTYEAGTPVTLTATPAPGFEFAGWSGDLSGAANPATITMDSDKAVSAHFVEQQFTLSVTIEGSGKVSLQPSGGIYPPGTVVQLKAVPPKRFQGWSDDLSGSSSTATITMDADKQVTASF
jgi:uncharacterized repeat protein (TIGR02543 family)